VGRVAGAFGLEGVEIKRNKRGRKVTDARGIISDLAMRVIGWNGAESCFRYRRSDADKVFRFQVFVREMGTGTFSKGRKRASSHFRSGVSIAANRGEALVRERPALMRIIENW